MAAKETSIATVFAAALAGGGSYATIDMWVLPKVAAAESQAQLAENKADFVNIQLQEALREQIERFKKELAQAKPSDKSQIEKKIDKAEKRLEDLQKQLLK